MTGKFQFSKVNSFPQMMEIYHDTNYSHIKTFIIIKQRFTIIFCMCVFFMYIIVLLFFLLFFLSSSSSTTVKMKNISYVNWTRNTYNLYIISPGRLIQSVLKAYGKRHHPFSNIIFSYRLATQPIFKLCSYMSSYRRLSSINNMQNNCSHFRTE